MIRFHLINKPWQNIYYHICYILHPVIAIFKLYARIDYMYMFNVQVHGQMVWPLFAYNLHLIGTWKYIYTYLTAVINIISWYCGIILYSSVTYWRYHYGARGFWQCCTFTIVNEQSRPQGGYFYINIPLH